MGSSSLFSKNCRIVLAGGPLSSQLVSYPLLAETPPAIPCGLGVKSERFGRLIGIDVPELFK